MMTLLIHNMTWLLKFTWDKKTILWEIENISEAVGRKNYLLPDKCNDHIEDSLSSSDQQSPIQYHSLMDIDCIHSTHFNAGAHEENKSIWYFKINCPI